MRQPIPISEATRLPMLVLAAGKCAAIWHILFPPLTCIRPTLARRIMGGQENRWPPCLNGGRPWEPMGHWVWGTGS